MSRWFERWEAWPAGRRAAALVALALAVRLVLVFTTVVIETDGPVYIGVAKLYAAGEYRKALADAYHPLFPVLVAAAHGLVGDWERAGQLPGAVLAALAILPIYFVGVRAFGGPVALAGALLYALAPYPARLSASVLTTGTYLTCMSYALWFGTIATLDHRPRWMFPAALAAGLGYLTHPGGLVLFVALGAGLIVQWVLDVGRSGTGGVRAYRATLGSGLLLLAAFAVTAAPYILWIRASTGHWNISRKVTAAEIEYQAELLTGGEQPVAGPPPAPGATPAPAAPAAPTPEDPTGPLDNLHQKRAHITTPWLRLRFAAWGVLVDVTQACHQVLFAFLLFGFLALLLEPDRRDGRTTAYLLGYTAANFAAVCFFAYMYMRVSKRYTTPIIVVLMPIIAWGIFAVARWLRALARWVAVRRSGEAAAPAGTSGPDGKPLSATPAPAAWKVWSTGSVALVCALLVLVSFKTFRPISADKYGERQAGEWLAQHAHTQPPKVMTQMSRISWYAGAAHVPLRSTDRFKPDQMLATARNAGVGYIAVDRHVEGDAQLAGICPGFLTWAQENDGKQVRLVFQSTKVAQERTSEDRILVYEVLP